MCSLSPTLYRQLSPLIANQYLNNISPNKIQDKKINSRKKNSIYMLIKHFELWSVFKQKLNLKCSF